MVKTVCEEANEIVSGPRQAAYGPPIKNFQRIADMWCVIIGVPITPAQVGQCMIAIKLARDVHQPKRDNLVDIAGYAQTIDLVRNAEEENDSRR